jgi:hypothetical protein
MRVLAVLAGADVITGARIECITAALITSRAPRMIRRSE